MNWNASPAIDERVEALLQHLTLEEKVQLVSGRNTANDLHQPYLPLAGIPPFGLADGPASVRVADPNINEGKSTALPAPIALAATWAPELAQRYGNLIGAEAVATGHNVLFGPAVDIARAPRGGRTFGSSGENPLLQARLVVPEVLAIQAHAVQATLKHYLVNNQEHQRASIDVRIDERTLQAIYLPPFVAAVTEGRAAGVMGFHNRINGIHGCENPTP